MSEPLSEIVPSAAPEFSHRLPLSEIGEKPRHLSLSADEAERAALALRFELPSLDALSANVEVWREEDAVIVAGDLAATVTQSCVVTNAPITSPIAEKFSVRLLPEPDSEPDDEIELGEADCDVMFYDGRVVDTGEVVAQTLALALDPFPRSASANTALKSAGVLGEGEAGPFAALAALRNSDG